nr:CNT_HP1_G0015840.mRNA.1.CDS.1 [Saccharomyces cerevisiae]
MLKRTYTTFWKNVFYGEDLMDDGTLIKLRVPLILINKIMFSRILREPLLKSRCLVGEDIPLNQGCLKPITIKFRKALSLSPINGIAVVGGNVFDFSEGYRCYIKDLPRHAMIPRATATTLHLVQAGEILRQV